MFKTCTACGAEKPLNDFSKSARGKHGRRGDCKKCHNAKCKNWRDRNKEHRAQYQKQWNENNPDYHREYYAMNSQSKAEYVRKYRREHPEQTAESDRKTKLKYPEKRAANIVVSNAIAKGKLTRQPCEICGERIVDAHHEDYSQPLSVRWLCKIHHALRHMEITRSLQLP